MIVIVKVLVIVVLILVILRLGLKVIISVLGRALGYIESGGGRLFKLEFLS